MAHPGYCETGDLYISGVRMPQGMQMTPDTAIGLAAEEIDTMIGMLYQTPISVEENDPDKRFDSLTLKRINALLASGRLITSMATGGEQNRVQAYGEYLLRMAFDHLKQIQTGVIKLTSATPIEQADNNSLNKGPILVTDNQQVSLVDSFYENFQPGGFTPGRNKVSDGPWPSESACPAWLI